MTDKWNIFQHSATESPPEKNPQWVRARIPAIRPSSWEQGDDLHIWPRDEDNFHTMVPTCSCDPEFDIEQTIDGHVLDRAVLHRAKNGKVVEH